MLSWLTERNKIDTHEVEMLPVGKWYKFNPENLSILNIRSVEFAAPDYNNYGQGYYQTPSSRTTFRPTYEILKEIKLMMGQKVQLSLITTDENGLNYAKLQLLSVDHPNVTFVCNGQSAKKFADREDEILSLIECEVVSASDYQGEVRVFVKDPVITSVADPMKSMEYKSGDAEEKKSGGDLTKSKETSEHEKKPGKEITTTVPEETSEEGVDGEIILANMAIYSGPNRKLLTLAEFEEQVKYGCGNCSVDIPASDHKITAWHSNGQPMCSCCKAQLDELYSDATVIQFPYH